MRLPAWSPKQRGRGGVGILNLLTIVANRSHVESREAAERVHGKLLPGFESS
jgi:hypothetical protein